MDRQIVYPAQIPLDSDQLNAQRNAYVGLGQLAAMAYGWATVSASGFACTPGSGLALVIAPGSLLAPGVVDASAYGTLAAVASALVRQYVSRDPVTLTVPGAGATYTVYVTPATVDTDDTVLPFYNAADPSVTYAGADNSGKTAPTVRQDGAQPGIGATVPDGAYPLWTITVPAGATAMTADMIAQASDAPFYDTIPQLQATKQDALGFTPVQQGGGIDQSTTRVMLGRDTTYSGLRYSYAAADGTITDGGYLASSYGPENGGAAGYGQVGDISSDTNGRLVWRALSLGSTYYTTALLSDVTDETARAEAAEATLNSNIGAEATARANADAALSANFANYLPLGVGGTNAEITYGDANNYTFRFQDDGNLVISSGDTAVFTVGAGAIVLNLPVYGNVRSGTVTGGTYTVINNVMTLAFYVTTTEATPAIDFPLPFSAPPVVTAVMQNTNTQGGVSSWCNLNGAPTATSVSLFTRSASGGVDYNAYGLVS
ncbi:hypothetical protein [Komagataeibacter swingsii]|uniref:hypothetical protein n=1 Tax=Komagataeibacter swingsii TaxID=215220 RepID=UPI002108F90C|nr:hypothetical protein [Komagataeibacter swingsii]